jgi:hypothetical protein
VSDALARHLCEVKRLSVTSQSALEEVNLVTLSYSPEWVTIDLLKIDLVLRKTHDCHFVGAVEHKKEFPQGELLDDFAAAGYELYQELVFHALRFLSYSTLSAVDCLVVETFERTLSLKMQSLSFEVRFMQDVQMI